MSVHSCSVEPVLEHVSSVVRYLSERMDFELEGGERALHLVGRRIGDDLGQRCVRLCLKPTLPSRYQDRFQFQAVFTEFFFGFLHAFSPFFFTGYHLVIPLFWVLLGFTGFHRVSLFFYRFYWVLLGITAVYRVSLGFTGFHWVLPGFTGFHWVSLGFTGFLLSFTVFF